MVRCTTVSPATTAATVCRVLPVGSQGATEVAQGRRAGRTDPSGLTTAG